MPLLTMTLCVTAFALILQGLTAFAADLPLQGVWRGTIGDQEVMVCFEDSNSGSYFYLQHLLGISLTSQDKATDTWLEGRKEKPSGSWKVSSFTGETLIGQWNDPNGKRTFPIRLERISAMGTARLCDAHAKFISPRIDVQKITLGEIKQFEGKPFRRISTLNGKVSSIQLVTDVPQLAHINVVLRNRFNAWIADYFDCRSVYYNDRPDQRDGWSEYDADSKPVFWTEGLLTLQETSFCSRAKYANPEYRTWDLAAGQEINLWTWLNPKAFRKTKSGDDESTRAFARVVAARWKASGRMCEEIADPDRLNYEPQYPTKRGIVFIPSLSGTLNACRDAITLTFSQLAPFLSVEGKAVAESIVQHGRESKTNPKAK